MYFCGLYQMF